MLRTVSCFLLATTAVAAADRGEITEASPATLEPGEVRVGLSDVAVGLFGHDLLRRIEIGTRPIAWLPNAGGLASYDVRGKFELWRDPHLSLAVAAEHMLVDLTPFVEGADADARASFFVTPLEGWAGLRLGRVRINTGAVYTRVGLRGMTNTTTIDELGGAVGSSTVQLRGNVEVGLSRTVHLVLGGRYVPWQQQYAEAGGSERVGENGEVSNTTRGEADLMSVSGRAWSASAELHFTWPHLNLRLGAEYGNYSTPVINFVTSTRGFMPTVDLYWRI